MSDDPQLRQLADRCLHGELSPAEQRRAMRRLRADAAARDRLREDLRFNLAITAALNASERDWARTRVLLQGVDGSQVYQRIESRLPGRSRRRRAASGGRRRALILLAATALLAVGGWAVLAWWPAPAAWQAVGLVDAPSVPLAGSVLRSGADPATVAFADGSSLRLSPRTHAVVAADGQGLDILAGALSAEVGGAAPAWLYRYRLAAWQVDITGTAIGLGLIDGRPRVEVHRGSVTIIYGRGLRRLGAGMSSDGPLRPAHDLVGWYPLLTAADGQSPNRSPRAELGPLLLTGSPLDDQGVRLAGNAGVNIADPDGRLAGLLRAGRCTIACWVSWPEIPAAGLPQTVVLLYPTGPRRGTPFWTLVLPEAARTRLQPDTLHHLVLRCGPTDWSVAIDGVGLGAVPAPAANALEAERVPVLHLCARWGTGDDGSLAANVATRLQAVAIYDRVLTQAQIRRCHAAGVDRVPRDVLPLPPSLRAGSAPAPGADHP